MDTDALAEMEHYCSDMDALLDQITTLQQALWDIYGILGFDQDGDKTPGPILAGARLSGASPNEALIGLVRMAAETTRKDYDDCLGEIR